MKNPYVFSHILAVYGNGPVLQSPFGSSNHNHHEFYSGSVDLKTMHCEVPHKMALYVLSEVI